ncbi:MAG: response regulator [Actinobacteria bacterium]|nr:response regulator [Actinomycetota bacterium]
MSTITVLIADDIPATREDIKRLLYFEEDIKIIGEAGDGDEAVKLSDTLKPDVILMDVNMPKVDGIKASEMITVRNQESSIIIISIQGEQEYLRKAMAAGARDYLVKPFSSSELAETIRKASDYSRKRRLRLVEGGGPAPMAPPREPGKIITLFSSKGGVGKTTAACNLAISLVQKARKKVALVDMDLQGGDISVFLNISAKGGLAEVALESDFSDPSLLETYFCPHMSGIRVLPAPGSPEQAELVTASHAEGILKALRDSYDYIVVDTAAAINDITLVCLEMSDQILVLLNQELPSLRHAKVNMEILEKLGLTYKSQLILNRYRNDGLKLKDLEKNINSTISVTLPDDEETVSGSINKGQPFVMTKPSADITTQLGNLAATLAPIQAQARDGVENAPRKSIIGKIFSF